jgi:hypothetical protein
MLARSNRPLALALACLVAPRVVFAVCGDGVAELPIATIDNQFGADTIRLIHRRELCVPSDPESNGE